MYQEQGQFLIDFFNQIWRILQVESPVFGLRYKSIVMGAFIIGFLIKILKWIFTPDMESGKDKGSENANT